MVCFKSNSRKRIARVALRLRLRFTTPGRRQNQMKNCLLLNRTEKGKPSVDVSAAP
ncbi:MAG: hypothetical protein ABIR81_05520 [Ginsengibacter sp.]